MIGLRASARFIVPFLLLLLIAARSGTAQPGGAAGFDLSRWDVDAAEARVETFAGRQAFRLQGGTALLKDVAFTDGVIAFDMAFPFARNFTGAVWRWQGPGDYEHFYVRPHMSGNPDANQYTPVFNGVSGWQLYAGAGYGAPTPYPFDAWMPVRIVVSGRQAEVYLGDLDAPALFIPDLKRDVRAGRVGLQGGGLAPTYFSNVRVTPQERPPLKGRAPEAAPETASETIAAPAGSVMAWQVSDVFAEADLEGCTSLGEAFVAARTWAPLRAEASGTANLARLHGIDEAKNTVFARVTVTSDRAQVRKLRFGFSDRVRVYLNGRLLYAGDDGYTSRDYRFLGTIGAFDALYLPLDAGANELWFAVSESFGGWGVLAFFEDAAGLAVQAE